MGKGRQQQLVRSLCCTSEVCAIPEEAKNRGNGDVLSRKMPSLLVLLCWYWCYSSTSDTWVRLRALESVTR